MPRTKIFNSTFDGQNQLNKSFLCKPNLQFIGKFDQNVQINDITKTTMDQTLLSPNKFINLNELEVSGEQINSSGQKEGVFIDDFSIGDKLSKPGIQDQELRGEVSSDNSDSAEHI